MIAPVQAWLLAKGQCVGCGMPLNKGKIGTTKDKMEKVVCHCGRVFIHDPQTKKYRRALFDEV